MLVSLISRLLVAGYLNLKYEEITEKEKISENESHFNSELQTGKN